MTWPTTLAQWEWALPELVLLAFLIWDVRRTGRAIRQDKERAEKKPPDDSSVRPDGCSET